MKYLYGASIQGIQSFIFETNKLKEIAGASEIVDYISSSFFVKEVGDAFNEDNLLVAAAGNIKYLFDNEDICKKIVFDFSKKVMEKAPGITISQAVVKIDGEVIQKDIQLLESRLKIQRNRISGRHGTGLMISERSRRTGKPGIEWSKDTDKELYDAAQVAKMNFLGSSKNSLLSKILPDSKGIDFPVEMNNIAGSGNDKDWIAIIHADGNNLGKMITKMAQEDYASHRIFSELSTHITKATTLAVQEAFKVVIEKKDGEFYPFRPVILGGDDLTVIIKGDLAIDFTKLFLKAFEEKTKEQFADFESTLFQDGLTACAGIAFIKLNYPFHYGVSLAEMLCKKAKKVAKNLNEERTPSCLLFHKVHSSFIEDYESIITRELTIKNKDNSQDNRSIRLDFGPYFLSNQGLGTSINKYATIDKLKGWVSTLNKKGSPKSRLRNWLAELQINKEAANQEYSRIKAMTTSDFIKELDINEPFFERDGNIHTHLFDAISLSSIEKI